jgi:2-polyprenyl-3-methyl-5-hydroxy-6-metoxy-1,4-benzoquinol methylase
MKKLDQFILRDKSVITDKKNLEILYSLKDFPVFFGCVDSPIEQDLVFDMEWAIDPETGVIQLDKLVPLDILYQSQHVDGCGPTWLKYYQDFSDYIIKKASDHILEVGGGAGVLANRVVTNSNNKNWIMVEPNPTIQGTERIKIVKGFFDDTFQYDGPVDTVVFSQVLEHAYDPDEFISHISKFLKKNNRLVFAYPNLLLWLQRKYTNAINFEHTMLLTDHHVDYLLAKNGFKIIDKETYIDHSYFYTAELVGDIEIPSLENKYDEYKKVFLDFVEYHENMVAELNKLIDSSDLPVYLFGAHIFSQFLIAFGLKTDKVVSILDNSPTKQGKRLYGTNLMVGSPKGLKDKGPVNVILKAGIYNDEIKKDILENINSNVTFW